MPALPSQERHFCISTRRMWKCRSCRKQFSPKAGTIFEVSPIGLDRWPIAIWMVANAEERVGSYKLHRLLGVTQTTAQFMLRRIRVAVQARKPAREECGSWSRLRAMKAPKENKPEEPHLDKYARFIQLLNRYCGGTQSCDLRTGSGAAAEAPAHYGRDEGREIAGGK